MNNAYNRVIGWNTTKTPEGFRFSVYSFDYQVARKVHQVGFTSTRASAIYAAKKAVRLHRAIVARG